MRNEYSGTRLINESLPSSDTVLEKKRGEDDGETKWCVGKVVVKGKFFYSDGHKLYLKGVTYGTFEQQADGNCFPDKETVENDFALMVKHGINCIRTYTVPTHSFLDIAAQYGLRVMVGIPWEQHILFLDSAERRHRIIDTVRQAVLTCGQHPAVLCFTIGNEIPSSIVRWYGKKRIERFLQQLYFTAKEVAPDSMVTYVNFPTTEYLDLSFLDFYCFNVYLETPEAIRRYILKLHNLAGDKPLVLAEIGIDSLRNGCDVQATFFNWQIPIVFAQGCAGMFVFAWTDEWWRSGVPIDDWKFGLVDSERKPKPALNVVHKCMSCIPQLNEGEEPPLVSVVICSYNGSATIRDCLEGVQQLDYPNYEVIVVNDGSTDGLEKIVKRYPVTLINTVNRGLSAARNTGLQYAQGEIVAYIDDDAYPDPQWLKYLVLAYQSSNHAGMGGPNLSPPDDCAIATCIAKAPGGPVHVLITDEVAEHIPGCNMSFKREALLEIGGFDPVFRTAGDDVDICWRIQQAGYTIGFHPAALVWHHRRNRVKTYWKQQKGYGKAEALLEAKWPEKYNCLGHLSWCGRIYGTGATKALKLKEDKVYHGMWGTALFQSIYEPANGFWGCIPLMPEWYLLMGVLGLVAGLGFVWSPLLWAWPIFILSILVLVVQATQSANNYIKAENKSIHLKYRLLIIALHLMQPLARLYGRIVHGLTPWRTRYTSEASSFLFTFKPIVFNYWSEQWRSAEDWLTDLEGEIKGLKLRVVRGGDFDHYDLQVYNGLLAKVRVVLAIEEHGGGKQYLRLKTWPCIYGRDILFIIGLVALGFIAANPVVTISLAAICVFLVARAVLETAACLSCIYAALLSMTKQRQRVKQDEMQPDLRELHHSGPEAERLVFLRSTSNVDVHGQA